MKLALVCFCVGVFVLYAYHVAWPLLDLVNVALWDGSPLMLLTMFARAYVAGFALGFCLVSGLFLMVKAGLLGGWEGGE